jgi:hypothetical protein
MAPPSKQLISSFLALRSAIEQVGTIGVGTTPTCTPAPEISVHEVTGTLSAIANRISRGAGVNNWPLRTSARMQ